VRRLLLISPLLVVFALALIWPLSTLALYSLRAGDALALSNYVEVVASRANLTSLGNTIVIAIASTALAMAICLPASLYVEGLDAKPARRRVLLSAILAVPLSLPGIVIGFFVILLFGLTGAGPYIVEWLTGTRGPAIAYTFWGMLLGYLLFLVPRMMLMLRSAAASVSVDVLDAARTLGATDAQVFVHTIVPAMREAIVASSALGLSTALGAFGTAATLSRGYRVAALEIASAFTDSFQPNLAAAMSVLLTLVVIVMLTGVNSLNRRKNNAAKRQAAS
jgi:putative spermidine/putrescine transport system permease protein